MILAAGANSRQSPGHGVPYRLHPAVTACSRRRRPSARSEPHQRSAAELDHRITCCGMTFAIILCGFDLSVGSMTALAAARWRDADDRSRKVRHSGRHHRRRRRLPSRRQRTAGSSPISASIHLSRRSGTMIVRGLMRLATNASRAFWRPLLIHHSASTPLRVLNRRSSSSSSPPCSDLFSIERVLDTTVHAIGGNQSPRSRWASTPRARFAVYARIPVRGDIGHHPAVERDGDRDARRRRMS